MLVNVKWGPNNIYIFPSSSNTQAFLPLEEAHQAWWFVDPPFDSFQYMVARKKDLCGYMDMKKVVRFNRLTSNERYWLISKTFFSTVKYRLSTPLLYSTTDFDFYLLINWKIKTRLDVCFGCERVKCFITLFCETCTFISWTISFRIVWLNVC